MNLKINTFKKSFGISNNTLNKINKKIGVNTRKNPFFLNNDKKFKINSIIKKLKTGKLLKDLIVSCIKFKKKIKIYKNSKVSNKNTKKNVKKKI
jgi:ribosomal protein S13